MAIDLTLTWPIARTARTAPSMSATLLLLGLALLAAAACDKPKSPAPDLVSGASPHLITADATRHLQVPPGAEALADEFAKAPDVGAIGGPRAGLTSAQLVAFVRGRVLFRDGPGIAGGLGPRYVQKSCGTCHVGPVMGGEGDMKSALTVAVPPGHEDVKIVQEKAIAGFAPEPPPAGSLLSKVRAPMLFGVGAIDTIAPEAIAALADPEDRDGDGVSGRVNERAGKLSRWGMKAHNLELRRFVINSLYFDLGLTFSEFEGMASDTDTVADPEANSALIDSYVAYIGNLAQPPRGAITEKAKTGAAVFDKVGCATCHKADLGPVRGIYSNLLLHDMGPDNADGIKDGVATGQEWRTTPLWGLRLRKAFFHDHRAKDLDHAIRLHRGESDRSRLAAEALDPGQHQALMAFLASL